MVCRTLWKRNSWGCPNMTSHSKGKEDNKGMLPGLAVNIEVSQSEPWSLDVSSIPGFA